MGELTAVFGAVWVAVAFYCSWLAMQQRRLRCRVEYLEGELTRTHVEGREPFRAA